MGAEGAVPETDRWIGPRHPLSPWVGLVLGGCLGLAAVSVLGLDVTDRRVVVAAGMVAVSAAAVLTWLLPERRRGRVVRWSSFVAAAVAVLAAAVPLGWPPVWPPLLVLVAAVLAIVGVGTVALATAARLLSGAVLTGLSIVYGVEWAVRGWGEGVNAVFAGLAVAFAVLGGAVLFALAALAGAAFAALGVLVAAGGVLVVAADARVEDNGVVVAQASSPVPAAVFIVSIGLVFLGLGVRVLARERGRPAGTPFHEDWSELMGLASMLVLATVGLVINGAGDPLAATATGGLALMLTGAAAEVFGGPWQDVY